MSESHPLQSSHCTTATTTALAIAQTLVSHQGGPNVNPVNPHTPVLLDDVEWVTAFMVIHMLSDNSRRYMYVLWMVVAFITIVAAILHVFGRRLGKIQGYWSKWAMRRRTWRGKHAIELSKKKGKHHYPVSLPANGQLLSLAIICGLTAALTLAGPDYIAPNVPLFFKRDAGTSLPLSTSHFLSSSFTNLYPRAQGDIWQYVGFQPGYTIWRAWWTLGGRTGLIAFALIPLCVLWALKAPPFALFALPFTAQYHFDKLSWLHKWLARLIYLLTLLHVAFWSVQLFNERRTRVGGIAYNYAWLYTKFIWGWVAFGLFTFLILASLLPVRKHFYEVFYYLHVVLVLLTLLFAGLHHPPVGVWCWAALGIWGAERGFRALRWLYRNGIFSGQISAPVQNTVRAPIPEKTRRAGVDTPLSASFPAEDLKLPHAEYPPSLPVDRSGFLPSFIPPYGFAQAELLSGATVRLTFTVLNNLTFAPGQHFLICVPSVSAITTHPFTVASACDTETSPRVLTFLIRAKSGWTRDLWDHVTTVLSLGHNRIPGEGVPEHVRVPNSSVLLRMWIDGPFGSAVRTRWDMYDSVCIVVGGTGVSYGTSILEFLCGCLNGRDPAVLGSGHPGLPWPFAQKATSLKLRHVRFVWLIREFSHLQWVAGIIRRCMSLVPPSTLKIDVFVTNFAPPSNRRTLHLNEPPRISVLSKQARSEKGQSNIPRPQADLLEPPNPLFRSRGRSSSPLAGSRPGPRLARSPSALSDSNSEVSDLNYLDLSYYTGDYGDEESDTAEDVADHHPGVGAVDQEAAVDFTLDLTNWEGDDTGALPGEDELSKRLRRLGREKRAIARMSEMVMPSNGGWNSSSAAALFAGGFDERRCVSLTVPDGNVGRDPRRNSTRSTDRLVQSREGWRMSRSSEITDAETEPDDVDLSAMPMDTESELPWATPAVAHEPVPPGQMQQPQPRLFHRPFHPTPSTSHQGLRINTNNPSPTASEPSTPQPGRPLSPLNPMSEAGTSGNPVPPLLKQHDAHLFSPPTASPMTPNSAVPFLAQDSNGSRQFETPSSSSPHCTTQSQASSHTAYSSHSGHSHHTLQTLIDQHDHDHESAPLSALSHISEISTRSGAYTMTATASDGKQARLRVSHQEMEDVDKLSQFARGGKPILERILNDELSVCHGGALLVACCGPSSLNAKVRKTIAKATKPGKNHIDLVSEDFSY